MAGPLLRCKKNAVSPPQTGLQGSIERRRQPPDGFFDGGFWDDHDVGNGLGDITATLERYADVFGFFTQIKSTTYFNVITIRFPIVRIEGRGSLIP